MVSKPNVTTGYLTSDARWIQDFVTAVTLAVWTGTMAVLGTCWKQYNSLTNPGFVGQGLRKPKSNNTLPPTKPDIIHVRCNLLTEESGRCVPLGPRPAVLLWKRLKARHWRGIRKFGPDRLATRSSICRIWAWRAWRLPGWWSDGGRTSTVAGRTRRSAAPAYAPIPDLTSILTIEPRNPVWSVETALLDSSHLTQFLNLPTWKL